MAHRSFAVTFAALMSPFLVWAAHFGLVYGINGIICARHLQDARLLGYPLSPALIGIVTVLALLWVAMLMARALGGHGPADHVAAEDPRRFARWFVAAGAGTALVAILWVALPALMVPACG
ncbi:hypothetical protein [Azospirillum picis]|uniref:Uncharacterized protein n=1 Tax=Azospirillum picis TaxID=488438 RepID=A0ABU0MRB1_9PROT|nr:hypothetical protein [Azospirillum picis]MBP2302444.1 hypothetical protein [Azospirillum picis]MDQ0536023.1 hypothetical protein [Azospirillum picis]